MSKRYAILFTYRDSQSGTEYEYVSEERYKTRPEAGSLLSTSVWVRGTESLRGGAGGAGLCVKTAPQSTFLLSVSVRWIIRLFVKIYLRP